MTPAELLDAVTALDEARGDTGGWVQAELLGWLIHHHPDAVTAALAAVAPRPNG